MIRKIAIRNYRAFEKFDLELEPGLNVLVGDNDSGKSTLIEAINLALTGRIQGRLLSQEFPPFLVNLEATKRFVEALQSGGTPPPAPEIIIDLFLIDCAETEILRGTNNVFVEDACGIRIRGCLAPDYTEEYLTFVGKPEGVRLIPTEYYHVEWLGFSGNAITIRSIPAAAAMIDPTATRLQSGTDYYLQNIIRTQLDPRERVELSRTYRSLRETFSDNESVKAVNAKLRGDKGEITDRSLSLAIDVSQRYAWEGSLTAHLDDLPFTYIGKGEQNAIKTLLALGRNAVDTQIVLVEEPENHLSFSSLRKLISKIESRCSGRQVVIATHSSFVLNKLGLKNLVLLSGSAVVRLADLPDETTDYFKKLPGYDTLRVVLAKRVILVEGPSDELVVQRAYRDTHSGRLPIDDGVDVISVRGLSFKRFLDLAVRLGRRVSVVRDNDGKSERDILDRYQDYTSAGCVTIHIGINSEHKTLEPQIVAMNELNLLNSILDTSCASKDDLLEYMSNNKTTVALAIFESVETIVMPEYVRLAVN